MKNITGGMRGLYVSNAAFFTASVLADLYLLIGYIKIRDRLDGLIEGTIKNVKRIDEDILDMDKELYEHNHYKNFKQNETQIAHMIEAMNAELSRFAKIKGAISDKNAEVFSQLETKIKQATLAIEEKVNIETQKLDEKTEAIFNKLKQKEEASLKFIDLKVEDNMTHLSDRLANGLASLRSLVVKLQKELKRLLENQKASE